MVRRPGQHVPQHVGGPGQPVDPLPHGGVSGSIRPWRSAASSLVITVAVSASVIMPSSCHSRAQANRPRAARSYWRARPRRAVDRISPRSSQ
ncbi:hypothetical protein [Streptomyces sennicomposti]